jgi:hemolysin activation/secretion protein
MAVCISAQAAGPNVDAGSLQRQAEQGLKQPQIQNTPKRKETPPPAITKPGSVTVHVTAFEFAGNNLVKTEQLNAIAAPYLNRPLSFDDLQEVANAVAVAYRKAGWVVRTYLPKQEIDQGVVTIQVVEAVLGDISLKLAPTTRIEASRIISTLTTSQRKGAPLSSNDVDRALLLLDDLPGINVTGNLVEGQRTGETDIALAVTDTPWFSGNTSLDNNGSRSTGPDRLSLNLALNSPMGWGDLLSTNLLKTQGSNYARLAYSVPVGYDGLRAGAHHSYLSYQLVGEFEKLNAKGSAAATGIDMSYPLQRSQMQNINLNLTHDQKRFVNIANSVTSSDYAIDVTNLSLSVNQYDSLAGGGANAFSLSASNGKTNLDNSPNLSIDAAGPRTAGNFRKANIQASRQQTITTDVSFYAAASAQAANKNLDSSEKIYLGGSSGVRAYPTSEGGGTQGQTLTLELRQSLAQNWTLTGFYDQGRIKVNHTNYATTSVNELKLKGRGLSLAWQGLNGVDLKATVARRLGDNPAPNSTTGMDGDGTLKRNRIWLNANVSF